ncbi:hypothetical protein RMCBS344292_01601 [Rhizopus microsporus]|nr:hypothetical protein RMCBS344292_01601 [Rhizopus microsporus]
MFYYFTSTVKGNYYFQNEWIKDISDFNEFDENTEYCIISMTTSPTKNEHWQCKVTRKIINQFHLNNIPQDKRTLVVNSALKGHRSLYGQELKWKVTRKEDDSCELSLLFSFDQELTSCLGSFMIYKVAPDQKESLQNSWIENSVRQCQDLFEINALLNTRLSDMEELYEEAKKSLVNIQARNAETYFTNLSKYTQLLNAKKLKIRKLLGVKEEQNVTIKHLQNSKRSNAELEDQQSQQNQSRKKRVKKTVEKKVVRATRRSKVVERKSSLKLPGSLEDSQDDMDEDPSISDSNDEDLFTQTNSQLPSQTIVDSPKEATAEPEASIPDTDNASIPMPSSNHLASQQINIALSQSETLDEFNIDDLFNDTDEEEAALFTTAKKKPSFVK